MKLLTIDTSSKNFSLAVSAGERIVSVKNVMLQGVLSSSIIPTIEAVLKKGGCVLSEVDAFVVGLGPGSFTSLRVGLSTIKALAFASGKPIVGIPSLDAIACHAPQQDGPICVVTDARREMVYACCYEKKNDIMRATTPYMLMNIKDLLGQVKAPALFVGDGIFLYSETITKGPLAHQCADKKYWYPQAKSLAVLGYRKFLKGRTLDSDKLIPLYLYPEDCQVKDSKSKEARNKT